MGTYGQATYLEGDPANLAFMATADDMLRSFVEKGRQLTSHYYPSDQRIQDLINRYLGGS